MFKAISGNYHESRKVWLLKQFETPEGNRFWRSDKQPVELQRNVVIAQKLNCIHQNPCLWQAGVRRRPGFQG
jgi:hypothetical protein